MIFLFTLLLGWAFGKIFGPSAGFWMNLQLRWDLYHAQKAEAQSLETIEPYQVGVAS